MRKPWKDQETVLAVKDCVSALVDDIDQDGYNEVVVRTRWPEKPYAIYDWDQDSRDREIRQLWPEAVSPEWQERLLTDPERYARLQGSRR